MLTLQLSDGRTLAYEIYGAPDGAPVIFSHGLSDSRLLRNPDDALTRSLGVRVIAVDQPGVGGSTAQPGRRLRDWAQDIEQLADALELDRFAVAGHSGGGPHALAIATHLPDRVTRGALAAPIAPIDLPNFSELLELKGALALIKMRHVPLALRTLFKAVAWWANSDIERYLDVVANSDRTDGDPDTFLADPDQRQMFKESFTAGFAQGAEGIIGMVEALFGDWGFTLANVPQHFDIFFGDLDSILKLTMGDAIADGMPDAVFHVWPDAGHYGFIDRLCWGEFLGILGNMRSG